MTDAESRAAAKKFAADWQGRGDEKQETQTGVQTKSWTDYAAKPR